MIGLGIEVEYGDGVKGNKDEMRNMMIMIMILLMVMETLKRLEGLA